MGNWPWPEVFAAVQRIAHAPVTLDERMKQVYEFAAANPDVYDEPDYWQRAASSDLPIDAMMAWAREGLENLEAHHHWSLLMLDCGDAPDVFVLTDCLISSEVSYESFEKIVRADVLRHGEEFPIPVEDERAPYRVAYHNVEVLNHAILSWNQQSLEYHENNGYLLWLAVATFALCASLQDLEFCKRILKGRQKVLVMVGFEEIFFYLGVVTAQGWGY